MAENKLSWTELRRAIAVRAGVSEAVSGSFLSCFTKQLVEALREEKSVKINGLGTFKLQAVAPRRSVNVTTGEEMTIAGYNKIVFVPEIGLKELIEKTSPENGQRDQAQGPKEEIDPLRKLGEQAVEIVDILGELGQKPNNVPEEPEVVIEEPQEEAEEEIVAQEEEAEEEAEDEAVDETPHEEEVVEEAPHEEEVVEEAPHEDVAEEEEKKTPKKYHFLRDTLICFVVLLLLMLVGYFFLQNRLSSWLESLGQPKGVETEIVVPDTIAVVEVEEAEVEVPEVVDSEPAEEGYTDIMLTEEITPGSRLAWIAKKHYGAKVYWPYLYDANRDVISDPCLITIGTPIKVPRLSATQLDTLSTRTRERLEGLRLEAESACGRN